MRCSQQAGMSWEKRHMHLVPACARWQLAGTRGAGGNVPAADVSGPGAGTRALGAGVRALGAGMRALGAGARTAGGNAVEEAKLEEIDFARLGLRIFRM